MLEKRGVLIHSFPYKMKTKKLNNYEVKKNKNAPKL